MVACGVRSQARCPCHFAWALGRNPFGNRDEIPLGLVGCWLGRRQGRDGLATVAAAGEGWMAGADDKAGRVLLWWLVG
jgi:hypothetical protein